MWTPNDFLKFRSFGKKSLVELEHALSLQGLTFDMKFAKEEISFLIKMTYEKDGRSVPKHLLELLYG